MTAGVRVTSVGQSLEAMSIVLGGGPKTAILVTKKVAGPVEKLITTIKRLHSDETIKVGNKVSYEYWSKKTTQEIIDSLKPAQVEPLITKMDGTIMQGNTRTLILHETGV